MKIKIIPIVASISLLFFGIGFFGIHSKLLNLRHAHHQEKLEQDRQNSVPISTGTFLILLTIGVAGALGIHRKNKTSYNTSQIKASSKSYDPKFNPFSKSVGMKNFWFGESQSKTLNALKKAVWGDANFIVLTGDSGVGKTTLIKYLEMELLPEFISVEISDEFQDEKDLFMLIAASAGINENFKSKGAFFIRFNQYLHSVHAENKKILLILNGLTEINDNLIKELSFLSNITIQHQKIIKILISCERIPFSPNEQFKPTNSSIIICRLEPLNKSETNSYIDYMLGTAGIKNSIFPQETIQNIFLHSQGIPREINKICDCALNFANELKLRTVDPVVIENCCKELNLLMREQKINYGKIPRKAEQTMGLFDNFFSRFSTWKLFDQQRTFPDINKQRVFGSFRKAGAKFYLFIHSTTKSFYLKQRNYWSTNIFISRLFDSFLWNSVLSVGLVALALTFALWYQGILPLKPDAPKSADFQKEYYSPDMDKEILYDKRNIQPSEQLNTLAMKQLSNDQQLYNFDRQNELELKPRVNELKSAKAGYFVQVGAFRIKENAINTTRMLKKKGYLARIVMLNDSKGRLWHTVRIGEYASLKNASKNAASFSRQEKTDSIVLPLRQP